jgi:ribosomal protein L11 methyltransferase
MAGEYWSLTVTLDGEAEAAAEAVTNLLWEAGAVGVVETEAAGAARALQAFFPPGTDAEGLTRQVGGYLEDLGRLGVTRPAAPPAVAAAPVPDAPWADAWRAHFRPLPVGRGLLVCPPWEAGPPAGPGGSGGRRAVVIEPGRAFGTGAHGTTRGCLELLEWTLALHPPRRRPDHAVDVGTGSGILAVTLALLGLRRVDALDPDPDAVAAATANAARNGVGDRVRVRLVDLQTWAGWAAGAPGEAGPDPPAPAPLVVANLLGATHVAEAAALGRTVAGGGRLIAGGLLVQETPAVVGAFVPEGFRLLEVTEHEGWATLLLTREPA